MLTSLASLSSPKSKQSEIGIATTEMTNLVLERHDPLARPEPVPGGVGEAVAEHHGVVLVVRGDRALEARRAGPHLQMRAR